MKYLLDLGNRYAKESNWTDFALTKFCLFSMGLAAGTMVTEKKKKVVVGISAVVFLATYIPLMTRLFKVAFRKDD